MKKAVQRILEENLAAAAGAILPNDGKTPRARQSTFIGEHSENDSTALLRSRKLEVERFQDKARRLVDCMRVPDLTHIPNR